MSKEKEQLTKNLLNLIPDYQKREVFNQEQCDIDQEFIGFIDIYKQLSLIIPKIFTVIDLGCGYNPQSFYFINHHKYVAVDYFPNIKVFQSPNCEFYNMTIKQFLDYKLDKYDLKTTFAICSYVPPWFNDNIELVRQSFTNVFTYYPAASSLLKPSLKKQK